MKWIYWISKSKRLAIVQTADTENEYGKRIVELGKHSNPNFEADARLIAAAPELLEALKGIIEYTDAGDYRSNRMTEILNAARDAVAKAEGDA